MPGEKRKPKQGKFPEQPPLVLTEGIEPTRPKTTHFECAAYTVFATSAGTGQFKAPTGKSAKEKQWGVQRQPKASGC